MTHEILTELPTVSEFRQLRENAGLSPRSEEAARRGLKNTIYGVIVKHHDDVVGMGRIVGDEGCVYQIVDVAVHPSQQGEGIGTRIVQALVEFIWATAPSSAYVCLIANIDGFYEQFGFGKTAPHSKAMSMTID